ncbi:MAG: hypothetical protein FWF94_01360 [Oscillospiraceae bacterium]|nr:hypothetical protein [Oscillospiraceae bacterium]
MFDIFMAYISCDEGDKKRPILILEQKDKLVSAFCITTNDENESTQTGLYKITEWQQAGLDMQSYIDTANKISLPISSVGNPIGKLTNYETQKLIDFLEK